MRFRPDWLRRVLHVPYVPTLGPVHADTLCVEVFDEVIAAGATGLSLPFDKDRRWSARKTEIVLADEYARRIVHRGEIERFAHQPAISIIESRLDPAIQNSIFIHARFGMAAGIEIIENFDDIKHNDIVRQHHVKRAL